MASGDRRVLAPVKSTRMTWPPPVGNCAAGKEAICFFGCGATLGVGGGGAFFTTTGLTGAGFITGGGGGGAFLATTGLAGAGFIAGGATTDFAAFLTTGLGGGGVTRTTFFGTGLAATTGAAALGWIARLGAAGAGLATCTRIAGCGARGRFNDDTGARNLSFGIGVGCFGDPGMRSTTGASPFAPGIFKFRSSPYGPVPGDKMSKFTSTLDLPLPPMTTVDCAAAEVARKPMHNAAQPSGKEAARQCASLR